MPRITDAQVNSLIELLDQAILTHGNNDPSLRRDLSKIRDALDAAAKEGNWKDFAFLAIRLAGWLKFIFDKVRPPD